MKALKNAPSRHLTEEDAIEIWVIRIKCRLYQHRIAAQFLVNQGRISEILTGKRFPDARAKALRRLGVNDNAPSVGGVQGVLI